MIRILSDLHIEGPSDPAYADLLVWIDAAVSGDQLVLAGDVFDFLVGRSHLFDRYSDFLDRLRQANDRGVRLHYIEGNHDVHLRRAFARRVPQLQLHSEHVSFCVGERQLYVAHGDLANPRDRGYRLWRSWVRSWPARVFFSTLPGPWLERLGEKLSELSRRQRGYQVIPEHGFAKIRPIYRSYAAEKAQRGFDYVVLGHCHDLDEIGFQIGTRTARYMNVGFPKSHRSFVACDETGIRRLPFPR